jgi:hypothetical protein
VERYKSTIRLLVWHADIVVRYIVRVRLGVHFAKVVDPRHVAGGRVGRATRFNNPLA